MSAENGLRGTTLTRVTYPRSLITTPPPISFETTVALSLSSLSLSKMGHHSDSYPPPLRHLNHHRPDEANPPLSDEANPTLPDDLVPVIDLHCLNDVVLQDKENKKLNEACEDWGVFRLVNHGVPKTLLEQLNGVAKQVFSMDFESKQASCDNSPVSYFWGTPALTPSGAALSGGPRRINLVEGFNVPLGQLSQFQPHLPQLQSFR